MKKLMALLLCVVIVGCTGCKNASVDPIVYEYTAQKIDYADGSFSSGYVLDFLQTSNAHYYFSTSVADPDRRSCIEATEQILKEFSTLENAPTICVLEIEDTYIEGNTLFLNPQDWISVDYATKVLLAASGQCSHYGLAYGYASLLCDRFGWGKSNAEAFAIAGDVEVYDLNYLCFDARFTSEADVSTAKSVSMDFVLDCMDKLGEESLQQLLLDSDTTVGMEHVASTLNTYYEANNQRIDVSTIRYGFGGVSNDYIVSTDRGIFYICKDWIDHSIDYNSEVSANFLHEAYSDIRNYFTINLKQMAQYQALFGLASYDDNLTVIFTNTRTSGGASEYRLNGHTIYLTSIMDLMHEYIHALTIPSAVRDLDNWEKEGFTTYFSVWYDFYSRDFLNNDYNSSSTLAPLREKLGRPLDVVTDNADVLNYVVFTKNWFDSNMNYWAGASFVGYLVNQYGLESVIQYIYGTGEPLSKPITTLTKDWIEFLQITYKDV